MADQRLRELERQAAQGDEEAMERLAWEGARVDGRSPRATLYVAPWTARGRWHQVLGLDGTEDEPPKIVTLCGRVRAPKGLRWWLTGPRRECRACLRLEKSTGTALLAAWRWTVHAGDVLGTPHPAGEQVERARDWLRSVSHMDAPAAVVFRCSNCKTHAAGLPFAFFEVCRECRGLDGRAVQMRVVWRG